MQGSTVEIGRRPGEVRPGGVGAAEAPWQADMDDRLAAFMRATADQQRRLGHALADALSTITHRVDRIEKTPDPQGGIASDLAQLRTAVEGLAARKDLFGLERAIARAAAAHAEREEGLRKEMADLARKLDGLAEARSPARLDIMADRLGAGADRLKEISAASERPDEASKRLDAIQETLNRLVEALQQPRGPDDIAARKAELETLRAAQAATELRLAEGLARIEAALSRPAAPPPPVPPSTRPQETRPQETRPGALRRTFIAAARRAAELRRSRGLPEDRGPKKAGAGEAIERGMDLPRPSPRSAGHGVLVLAVGAFLLASLHYLTHPPARSPQAMSTTAAVEAVAPAPEAARAPAETPPTVVPPAPAPAPAPFSAADQATLDEFASRLLRGDQILRDRALEAPAATPKPITENSRS